MPGPAWSGPVESFSGAAGKKALPEQPADRCLLYQPQDKLSVGCGFCWLWVSALRDCGDVSSNGLAR